MAARERSCKLTFRWGDGIIVKRVKVVVMLFTVTLVGLFSASAAELPNKLVPMGTAIGITVKTDGVIVADLSEIDTDSGKVSPAKDAGILPGDVITMVNGCDISSAEDIVNAIENCSGEAISVKLLRDGKERQVTVEPYYDGDDSFLGVWIRDGLTGIGTMTYYDPETGCFGALGHSISDSETGLIIPLREGNIMAADITGAIAGKVGTPGQLCGTFDFDGVIGSIDKNCGEGIFGTVNDSFTYDENGAIEVATDDEIEVGDATVLSCASGELKEYDIEITRLYSDNTDGRSMMIKITDDELLKVTGGIVQGMSGSPIIQNGKLIGAVIHVLINDPQKGYGVSIEDMLDAAA
jgi:stage IV sporulation protein B